MMEAPSESKTPPDKAERVFVKLRKLNPGEVYDKRNHQSKAIHAPRKHGPVGARRDQKLPKIEASAGVAANNASDLELEPAREEIKQLVQRSMSAAEAGIRLYSLFQRHPNLLADQPELSPSALGGGRKEGSRRELLPLPLHRLRLVPCKEVSRISPSDRVLGHKEKKLGAEH